MIDYIKGEIADLAPARMLMECYGIGYEINISLTTFTAYQGKKEGKIYVYEVIREDAHLLYGFATVLERELFLLLTSVSGVGPNTARMILSSFQPTELVQVIASKDETALTSVKGNRPTHSGRSEEQSKINGGFGSGSFAKYKDHGSHRSSRRSRCCPSYVRIPESSISESGYVNSKK